MVTSNNATTPTGQQTVLGVFDNPSTAEQALTGLKEAGFAPDQVSVVAKDTGESREMVDNTGMGDQGAAAGTGAVVGGLLGGALGWLVGIGALAIPGIGPIVAAGALATTLGGAAVGAAAGGLIGALAGMGVPEEDARGYEEHVKGGRILLTVQARSADQAQEARDLFDRLGGTDVRTYGASA